MHLEKAHICEKLPTVVSFIHPSLWKSSVMQEWKLDFNKKEGSRVHSLVATTLQEREK